MEARRDLLLLYKEALHNVARHSRATSVTIELRVERAQVFGDGESAVAKRRDGHELPRLVLMDIGRRVLDMFTQLAVGPRADYGLSGREREILELLVAGNTKGEIAQRLSLSPHTIDGHVRSIYAKLHVNNRSGAVAKALKERIL